MTIKQLQVTVSTISSDTSLLLSLINMGLTRQVRQITDNLAAETGDKQSAIELELYTATLCSCVFGVVCEAANQNIPLKEGQSVQIQRKMKQLAVDLIVNELQDTNPQPSEN